MEDNSISENKKNALITDMLRDILYMNSYTEHVFFVVPDGRVYSAMRPPEIMLNTKKLLRWHQENFQEESRKMQMLPVHTSAYYVGTENENFTASRNIMNTRTIQTAEKEILGTLYIDISSKYLNGIINETRLENGNSICILDKKKGKFVYNSSVSGDMENEELKNYLPELDTAYQYINSGGIILFIAKFQIRSGLLWK